MLALVEMACERVRPQTSSSLLEAIAVALDGEAARSGAGGGSDPTKYWAQVVRLDGPSARYDEPRARGSRCSGAICPGSTLLARKGVVL
jgi:hypothetical protein